MKQLLPGFWQGTFVSFRRSPNPGRKTQIWMVDSRGSTIGEIRWWSAWRRYCFFPHDKTLYEEVCLRELADFIVERTKEHKEASNG